MRYALALAVLFAAASAAGSAATTRHVEYVFAVYPRAAATHFATSALSGPGTGTLAVDITDAPDGSTRLRAQEWWWHEPRPEGAVECTLATNGDLRCTEYPLIDAIESVMLPMFAPRYFSGSARYTYTLFLPANYYATAWTIDVSARTWSGAVLAIDVKGSSHIITGPLEHGKLAAHVLYDRARVLPDEIHADLTATTLESGIDESPSMDAKLTKDSSASASGSPPAPASSPDRPSTF
ncbi:MAG TPA: hypothetical protein VFE16_02180 [Candidatus Cybelea sp.]|jgi:hypothetical protein|nr:hypothetical protein [Candidatus Cybelea sp.]